MLDKFFDAAMQRGMKLMGDPRVMKFMSTPTGQKVMTVAFQLPGKIEGAFAEQGRAFAKRFKLATRSEVDQLKSTISDLEHELHSLQTAQSQSNQANRARSGNGQNGSD